MTRDEDTCWTMVRGAREGDADARGRFATTYLGIVRSYLRARWRGRPELTARVEDAVQDVFMDCFRENGALLRLDDSRAAGFRAYLFGVVRHVALRFEERVGRAREEELPSSFDPSEEQRQSRIFDREWARNLLARAAKRQAAGAQNKGAAALRRVELLELRFKGGLPIREIARRWNEDPALVHREYAKARDEFKLALTEELAFEHPNEPTVAERECSRLLELLK